MTGEAVLIALPELCPKTYLPQVTQKELELAQLSKISNPTGMKA
jgi:hypothetical protein